MNITIGKITPGQLLQHYKDCNMLIDGVDMHKHFEKLCALATMVLVHTADENLIGLCACYMNDFQTKTAYITHIAISSEYRGRGYGKELLEKTIAIAQEQGFQKLNLEVMKDNLSALALYRSHDFTIIEDRNTKYLMSLHLANKSR